MKYFIALMLLSLSQVGYCEMECDDEGVTLVWFYDEDGLDHPKSDCMDNSLLPPECKAKELQVHTVIKGTGKYQCMSSSEYKTFVSKSKSRINYMKPNQDPKINNNMRGSVKETVPVKKNDSKRTQKTIAQ